MNTQAINEAFKKILSESDPTELAMKISGAVLTVIFILVVFKVVQILLGKILHSRITPERLLVVRKIVRYSGYILALLYVFKRMGIDTTAILGAAGVAGIVLGFAAQTSVSSLISGIFLLSEKPFGVGDTISVNGVTGTVLSVDILSVKLRTFDNLYVRIPNETITANNLTTMTRFPIRRLDTSLSVGYGEDLERVGKVLQKVAEENPWCLAEPAPFYGVNGFGDSGINIVFNVWFEKSNYWNVKNSLLIGIKKTFDAEHIEIPYQKIDISVKESNNG